MNPARRTVYLRGLAVVTALSTQSRVGSPGMSEAKWTQDQAELSKSLHSDRLER